MLHFILELCVLQMLTQHFCMSLLEVIVNTIVIFHYFFEVILLLDGVQTLQGDPTAVMDLLFEFVAFFFLFDIGHSSMELVDD